MTTAYDDNLSEPRILIRHRLRIAREHAGMDQTDLAIAMGVARSTVSNAEAGNVHPQRSTMRLWAWACGVPLEWIIGDGDDGDPMLGLRIISEQRADHHRNMLDKLFPPETGLRLI